MHLTTHIHIARAHLRLPPFSWIASNQLASTLPPHLDLLNTRSRLRTDSLALPGSSPTDLFALVVVVSGAEENAQLFVMPLVWKAEELEEMVPVSEVPWREVLEYGIKSGRAVWD